MQPEIIVQKLFEQLKPAVRLEAFITKICDYMVNVDEEGLSFSIEVKKKQSFNSSNYRDMLGFYIRGGNIAKIPVVVACVDDVSEEVELGLAISWQFGFPVVEHEIDFQKLTKEKWPLIVDKIKAADSVIHSLSSTTSRFLKKIKVYDGVHEMYFSYFRDFSLSYRMKDHPEDENKFEVYLKGVDEKLYPSDELDKQIIETVKKRYPSAEIRTSLFIFSAELRNLMDSYKRYDGVDFTVNCYTTQGSIISLFLNGYSMFKGGEAQSCLEEDVRITKDAYDKLQTFHTIKEVIS